MIIIDEVLKRIRENIAPVEKSGYYATVYIDNWIYRNTGDDKRSFLLLMAITLKEKEYFSTDIPM